MGGFDGKYLYADAANVLCLHSIALRTLLFCILTRFYRKFYIDPPAYHISIKPHRLVKILAGWHAKRGTKCAHIFKRYGFSFSFSDGDIKKTSKVYPMSRWTTETNFQ